MVTKRRETGREFRERKIREFRESREERHARQERGVPAVKKKDRDKDKDKKPPPFAGTISPGGGKQTIEEAREKQEAKKTREKGDAAREVPKGASVVTGKSGKKIIVADIGEKIQSREKSQEILGESRRESRQRGRRESAAKIRQLEAKGEAEQELAKELGTSVNQVRRAQRLIEKAKASPRRPFVFVKKTEGAELTGDASDALKSRFRRAKEGQLVAVGQDLDRIGRQLDLSEGETKQLKEQVKSGLAVLEISRKKSDAKEQPKPKKAEAKARQETVSEEFGRKVDLTATPAKVTGFRENLDVPKSVPPPPVGVYVTPGQLSEQGDTPPNTVRLNTGESVALSAYSRLTEGQKRLLKQVGVAEFNRRQDIALANKTNEAISQALDKFNDAPVTGSPVVKATRLSFPPSADASAYITTLDKLTKNPKGMTVGEATQKAGEASYRWLVNVDNFLSDVSNSAKKRGVAAYFAAARTLREQAQVLGKASVEQGKSAQEAGAAVSPDLSREYAQAAAYLNEQADRIAEFAQKEFKKSGERDLTLATSRKAFSEDTAQRGDKLISDVSKDVKAFVESEVAPRITSVAESRLVQSELERTGDRVLADAKTHIEIGRDTVRISKGLSDSTSKQVDSYIKKNLPALEELAEQRVRGIEKNGAARSYLEFVGKEGLDRGEAQVRDVEQAIKLSRLTKSQVDDMVSAVAKQTGKTRAEVRKEILNAVETFKQMEVQRILPTQSIEAVREPVADFSQLEKDVGKQFGPEAATAIGALNVATKGSPTPFDDAAAVGLLALIAAGAVVIGNNREEIADNAREAAKIISELPDELKPKAFRPGPTRVQGPPSTTEFPRGEQPPTSTEFPTTPPKVPTQTEFPGSGPELSNVFQAATAVADARGKATEEVKKAGLSEKAKKEIEEAIERGEALSSFPKNTPSDVLRRLRELEAKRKLLEEARNTFIKSQGTAPKPETSFRVGPITVTSVQAGNKAKLADTKLDEATDTKNLITVLTDTSARVKASDDARIRPVTGTATEAGTGSKASRIKASPATETSRVTITTDTTPAETTQIESIVTAKPLQGTARQPKAAPRLKDLVKPKDEPGTKTEPATATAPQTGEQAGEKEATDAPTRAGTTAKVATPSATATATAAKRVNLAPPRLRVPRIVKKAGADSITFDLPEGQFIEWIGWRQGKVINYLNAVTGERRFSDKPLYGVVPDKEGLSPAESLRVISTSTRKPTIDDTALGFFLVDFGPRYKDLTFRRRGFKARMGK